MRKIAIAAAVAVSSLGPVFAQGQAGNPPSAAPAAPTDKAAYFDSKDIHEIWKDEEAKQVINKGMSVTAAGSMLSPRWSSSQYDSNVTLSAQPVRGPIG